MKTSPNLTTSVTGRRGVNILHKYLCKYPDEFTGGRFFVNRDGDAVGVIMSSMEIDLVRASDLGPKTAAVVEQVQP